MINIDKIRKISRDIVSFAHSSSLNSETDKVLYGFSNELEEIIKEYENESKQRATEYYADMLACFYPITADMILEILERCTAWGENGFEEVFRIYEEAIGKRNHADSSPNPDSKPQFSMKSYANELKNSKAYLRAKEYDKAKHYLINTILGKTEDESKSDTALNNPKIIGAMGVLDTLFKEVDPVERACSDLLIDVSNWLWRVRRDIQADRLEVAKRIGMPLKYIEDLESCEYDPHLSEIAKYVAILAPDKKIEVSIK